VNKKHLVQIIMGAAITGSLFLSVVSPAAAQTTPTPDLSTATPAALATETIIPSAATEETAAAQAVIPTTTQSLCLPYMDSSETNRCVNAGPAQKLASLAGEGITYPAEPLAIAHPPLELNSIPYTYARVVADAVPMYASVEDAAANNVKEMMPAGKFKFVALNQKQIAANGLVYYQIANNDWISSDVISKVAAAYFQGYLIKSVPTIPFGWILQSQIPSYTAPSYNSAKTGKLYNRLDIIYSYDSKTDGDVDWIKIGPNEWMDHKYIGRVINHPTAPKGVTNGRWIEVNLYEQVMTVYENNQMIFATLIGSGGAPFYTKPGIFQIYRKIDFEYMTGAFESDRSDYYYIEQVPYIMYYDDARALHGAYWNNYLGYPGSHGCVNISVADAHWLYDWSNVGDTVYVWDPSGKTPTDSSLYGQGAF
jgi:lipoprotein-anchoring transpeptidase ErfK/SrfK